MSEENIKKKHKRKIAWSAQTESLLCDIWAEKNEELRGVRKNMHVYAEMCQQLFLQGFECTIDELKTKLHNLSTKYKYVQCNNQFHLLKNFSFY